MLGVKLHVQIGFKVVGEQLAQPFGFNGGGEREAKRLRVPLLGQIPIDIATREAGDRGMPIVGEDPQSPVTREFLKVAERVREALA